MPILLVSIFWFEKEVRDFLYPNYFFCAHCDDCIEAIIRSVNKKAIKRGSRAFRCKGGHTNFITPTNMIDHKQFWHLFKQETPKYPETPTRKGPTMSTMTPATSTRVSLPTVTPPAAATPAYDVPLKIILPMMLYRASKPTTKISWAGRPRMLAQSSNYNQS
jgi:hypothetical protein